jgi:hypothetical protein
LGMGDTAKIKLNEVSVMVRHAEHCSDLLYFACYNEVKTVVISCCIFNNFDKSIDI